jgi:hypothetical protein
LPRGAIRAALARDRYARGEVRIADPDVSEYSWLVATHRGLFAVSDSKAKTVMHGWFFGICRDGDTFYLFENCGARDPEPLDRIVRFRLADGHLLAPSVIAAGLHNNCHQIRMIDGLLCLMDTANQAILRFDAGGAPLDVQRPFPTADPASSRGDYLHINSIARIGQRIAIMLHNGKARPEKQSELAWLDRDWKLRAREPLPGHSCHDIVEDESGRIWHSASMSGEVIGSDGTRIKVSDELMTRGIAIGAQSVIVGVSTFGPRHVRETLNGGVVILDRNFRRRSEIRLPAGPTDVVSL